MARHRIERQPRHRAQRPAKERRRVQFPAAIERPPSHARPGSPDGARVPWQAIGATAADRLIALGVRLLPYQKRLLSGAARRLVVSPWFAAGGGIVVAAGAFIVAPHAQLNFGPAIARSPCTVAKCHHAAPLAGAPPVPAGAGVGPVTPSPTATPEPPNGADLIFKYSVTWHTRDMFQMVLTVTSKKAIRTWQLSFVIPAAADVKVSNADWQPSGTDGGMASSTTVGSGGPVGTHSAAPSAGASVGDSPASDNPDVVSLVVTGNGAPAAPQSCSFDGSACSFSPS